MSTYENAFQKAMAEGKIGKDMFPWEQVQPNATNLYELEQIYHDLPDRLKQLPFSVLNEFQIISENIRSAAIQNSLNVIGITSPTPYQGTSTLSAILSMIIASGKRSGPSREIHGENPLKGFPVLLIDAQVRNPSLHHIFQINGRRGLFDLLNFNASLDSVIKDVDTPQLKLITVGEDYDHFVHDHFENLRYFLGGLKSQFEFVFMDIPPVLHYAEGIALSKLCDGIVMVVQAGQTRWEVVQEANRALQKANINVIGGILNHRKYYIPNWLYRMI